MQSARGAAFSDVSSAAHRLWDLFTPDSDPSVAFVQARVATASVSDEFVRATNTLVLALRHFHNNARCGYVWNPTEYRPDATAHPNPLPTTTAPTAATPPHPTADTLTLAMVPSPVHQDPIGTYDGRRTSRRYAPVRRGGPAEVHTTRTSTVPDQRRRRLPGHVPGSLSKSSAALLRLSHSGSCVSLYLAMVFLSAICSSKWFYPGRLGLITRCRGIYSPMSLFRIAASSTPFPGLLG